MEKLVDTKNVDKTRGEDPDDNKLIECAIASDTKIIVSGDKHLLKIKGFKGIKVHKPREFVEIYLD